MSNLETKEQEIKELKENMLKDTEILAKKQRFGLFSSPLPLGLGDDSYDYKKRPPRGENGKPITEVPNVKVTNPKSGRVKSSYFSVSGYTTIGDPYVDPARKDLQYELEKNKKILFKDQQFKPSSGYKELVGGPYIHLQEYDSKPIKNRKQADGRVYSAPRNVTTNPYNKQLTQGLPHMKDEYQRFHDYELKLQKEAKKKEKEVAFKTTVYGGENFGKDKQIFGFDGKAPPASPRRPLDLKSMKHETAFRPANPSKKSWQGNFNKIEYKGDPEKKVSRREWNKGKEAFKPNNLGNISRPTPTISCFKMNIRRQMSAKGF